MGLAKVTPFGVCFFLIVYSCSLNNTGLKSARKWPLQFKPVLFKSQLYFLSTIGNPCLWRVDYSYTQDFQLWGRLIPLTLALFKGQLYIILSHFMVFWVCKGSCNRKPCLPKPSWDGYYRTVLHAYSDLASYHRGEAQRQWEIRNVIRISCSVQRQVLREDAIQKGCVTLVEKRGQNTTPGDVTKSKEPNMHVMGWTPRAMTQMQSPWQHRRGGDWGEVKPSFCHQLSHSQQGFLLPRFQENIKHMSSLLKTEEIPMVLISMSVHHSTSTKEWWVASRYPSLHTQTHPSCLLFLENMVAEFTISTAF